MVYIFLLYMAWSFVKYLLYFLFIWSKFMCSYLCICLCQTLLSKWLPVLIIRTSEKCYDNFLCYLITVDSQINARNKYQHKIFRSTRCRFKNLAIFFIWVGKSKKYDKSSAFAIFIFMCKTAGSWIRYSHKLRNLQYRYCVQVF